jgi:hypothetical protein
MFTVKFVFDPARVKVKWAHKFPESFSDVIIEESEGYKSLVEKKWLESEEFLLEQLALITGLHPTGTYTVYTLHPNLEEGQYLSEHEIEWGYADLYPKYIILGLTHELLHCITHNFYEPLSDDEKWVFHALVYLSVDEELYRMLNSESEYFSCPILSTYHPRLIETAQCILPYWKERMQNDERENLYDFYKKLSTIITI